MNVDTPKERTTITEIIKLLEFCLQTTTLQKTEGLAMGSPTSPVIANIHMYVYIT